MAAYRYLVQGRVQGVGYRYFVLRQADAVGLVGHVRNLPDGRVEVVAEGPEQALTGLESRLREVGDVVTLSLYKSDQHAPL